MRPLLRGLALAAFTALATLDTVAVEAQTVSLRRRSAPPNDSLIARVYSADANEVRRMVLQWREREEQLVRELRAANEADFPTRRRIEEQLAMNARNGFTMMSAIESRCSNTPSSAGYIGLNLDMQGRVVDREVRDVSAVVTSVEAGSPAERAGLRAQDRLLLLGGLSPERFDDVGALLVPGRTITVRIERDGAPREIPVVVARRAEGFGAACDELSRALMPMRIPDSRRIIVRDGGESRRNVLVETRENRPTELPGEMSVFVFNSDVEKGFFGGAEFRKLDADWGEVLGVKQGVIVGAVAAGSAAAIAGLKSGDVVTLIEKEDATSPGDLVRRLSSQSGSEAKLTVVRGRERRTVTMRWGPR